MDFDRFRRLLERMERSQVAALTDLVGCSEPEVAALEAAYGLRLPKTYTLYLRVMGNRAGRLFAGDHLAAAYPQVLGMTAEERRLWAECNAADGSGPPPGFALPADALLVGGRLGEQFEFIRCVGADDSPVWYFNTWDWQVRETEDSVLGWLERWCGEAEAAIAAGYFDLFPDGTSP